MVQQRTIPNKKETPLQPNLVSYQTDFKLLGSYTHSIVDENPPTCLDAVHRLSYGLFGTVRAAFYGTPSLTRPLRLVL